MAQLYDVILTGYPADRKISVIKALREITGMGLAEAKAMSESLPRTVVDQRDSEHALAIQLKLQEAGGQVSLIDNGETIEALDQQRDVAFERLFEIVLEPGYPPHQKILLIKLIREYSGLGLADAKHYSESLPRTVARELDYYRVTEIKKKFEQAGATVTVRLSSGEIVDPPVKIDYEEPYEVILEPGYDPAFKIGLIKVIRELTFLGLAEAKHFVESLPKTVKEGISYPRAKELREQLENAHGRVTIRQMGASRPVTPAEPAQPKPKQTVYRVILSGVPAEWYYAAINVVRELTGLSLVESGDLVDKCPKAVYEGPDQTRAQQTLERLTKARLEAYTETETR